MVLVVKDQTAFVEEVKRRNLIVGAIQQQEDTVTVWVFDSYGDMWYVSFKS